MFRTRIIELKRETKSFSRICNGTRALRNTANFYIRNTMTGIRKSPEERTHNETEVLHFVFTGIQKANTAKDERFVKAVAKAGKSGAGSLAAHALVHRALKSAEHFQYPAKDAWFLNYYVLDAVFKETKNPAYYALPAQVNQNAIRKTENAWMSYFKQLKDYGKHPGKYKAKPRIPGYIKSEATCVYTNQTARLIVTPKRAEIIFAGISTPIQVGRLHGEYVKTEVRPKHGRYYLLVTTNDEVKIPGIPEKPKRILGIDKGLTNFLAAAGNFGDVPFLIKGGAIKAANQWFNKRKAFLISELTRGSDSTRSIKESKALFALGRKRDDRIRDFFYKCAHYIARYAGDNGVDLIVIGHNEGQKDNINLSRVTNQNFVSVPFVKFVSILINVCARYGIPVTQTEESYTSQANILNMDPIPVYGKENGKVSFSGKRVKRGLYKTNDGILINDDINAAANTIRKLYPDAFEGADLSYLYSNVRVVAYKDFFPAKKTNLKYTKRRHKHGRGAAFRHHERAKKKTSLMRAFGGKKKFIPQKKKAS